MAVIWVKRAIAMLFLCCATTGCIGIKLLEIREYEVPVIEEEPKKQPPARATLPPAIQPIGIALLPASDGAFSAQEIILRKSRGVSLGYLAALDAAGRRALSPDQIIDYHSRGVDPKNFRR